MSRGLDLPFCPSQAEYLLAEADRIEEQRNKEQQRESGAVVRIMELSKLDVMADTAVSGDPYEWAAVAAWAGSSTAHIHRFRPFSHVDSRRPLSLLTVARRT